MNLPLENNISVIIPVYNAAPFIRKAVESALMQPETKEVILIEDGSKDVSLNLCKSLQGKYEKIKLFTHQNNLNKGAGASRNLGIQKASGAYIAFLDADDYYLPNRFATDRKIFLSGGDIDGVYNALGSEFLDSYAKEKRVKMLTSLTEIVQPDKLFYEMSPIGDKGYFSGVALTVKKSVFDKVGLFNPDIEIGEDTHMWLKMAMGAKLVAGDIYNPCAIRGIHENNRSQYPGKILADRPLLYKDLLNWSVAVKGAADKRQILWLKLYDLTFSFKPKGKLSKFKFVIISAFRYPFLLRYRSYFLKIRYLIQ